MSIFNSLGSNHTFFSAIRMLFTAGGASAPNSLRTYLEKRYGGRAILTYKGREALGLAFTSLPAVGGSIAINGFTCWAVFEALHASGYKTHYLDISDHSLHFSADALNDALTEDQSIRAVVIQNTLGIPCDIEPIAALCREHNIALIEDLAHSIGTQYASGQEAGTVGDLVVLSFSQDKVIDAVSGGALIIRNEKYAKHPTLTPKRVGLVHQIKDRLYPLFTCIIRQSYTFGLGGIIHQILRSLNMLSRPLSDTETSELHGLPGWYCAVIHEKYVALEAAAKHRQKIAQVYTEMIDARVQFPRHAAPEHSANLRFPLVLNGRDLLIQHLKNNDVHVGDIWYDAPVGPQRFLYRTDYSGECPRSEDVASKIVNLPTHINVSPAQAHMIARAVNEWLAEQSGDGYSIRTISQEVVWEDFMRAMKPHSFLHSWKWGEHFEKTGSKIFRVGIYHGHSLAGVALLIKVAARRGLFLLCPHGPLVAESENEEEVLRMLAAHCTRIAADERCDFIRFCPLLQRSAEHSAMYRRLGFSDAPIHMHPEISWMLDITKSEDELLMGMRKTTRYLIKKMEKEGVVITTSKDPADMEHFSRIYEATVERQQFTPFSKSYLRTEFELYVKDDQALFFFGKQKGVLVAAAIIIFYNGQAFYHHSGSLSSGSNVSYLLQWRVIQEAKRRGCTLYNFWGVAPEHNSRHAWTGLSRFKRGFGGFAEHYLHAQDKALTARYLLNYVIETVRRIRRHL
ncbi:hypothetical protein A2763_03105 [Candidatus Kaiserbacteria bacterium RIFCSPHIGHO2_01_FULL_54_36]|uniref:BioF2-like acetyltransferase domain-containing protein n=1 Tax=Candidatus Kaiserbacteria bacterium RIFCSPHIGHO2_01_FULL_54_36 TaxID=1798482 RepID=A0A1F6CK70_9BACT|nr:MAG: hypothetical protein A2763_03105 [Candidatus Kaiserbacteria bacterium RIFCSPHIGHO2_01_FULL_54_36]OGG75387.1 MAG: hypothetical protein A3A41_02360 [Candidatus Kaiserbacteria bacterium RIFCSPLOWO2_01_FULL_54_22]